MIAIVDYGCGNLYSLQCSLNFLNLESKITSDPEDIKSADKIILPGVGAFGDAVELLKKSGLDEVVKAEAAKGKYILGICLGMQLLFEKSFEYGEHNGLGLIKGEVCPLSDDIKSDLKIPHMGWNSLNIKDLSDPIFKYTKQGDYVYYVHSFYAKNCDEALLASSDYEVTVPGLVKNKNVYGAQFHPEKSGDVGLNLLKAFAELEEN
ncbi:MAG: imidazole glycerol phosphate synthase subunit HisH [Ruminococcaceae bacterium]|nr:imidazole glycerol phosphate synthase subunit HisH [Oscillospiraceae bacterium]